MLKNCFHPRLVRKAFNPVTGACKLSFNPYKPPSGFVFLPEYLPYEMACGQCVKCRLEKSRQTALRIVNEARLSDKNSFITLTYDAEHLPPDGSLCLRDIQLFKKNFSIECKRKYGVVPRYFCVGEYGEKFQRPHYHVCVFGFDFPDKVQKYVRTYHHGNVVCPHYTSEFLSKIWKRGIVEVCDLTFDSAAYCARYCLKKVNGKKEKDHYQGRKPEFSLYPLRPGLGRLFYEKYKDEIHANDGVFTRLSGGNIIKIRPPKYYDYLYDIEDPIAFAALKTKRLDKMHLTQHNSSHVFEVEKKINSRNEKHFRDSVVSKLIRNFEKL